MHLRPLLLTSTAVAVLVSGGWMALDRVARDGDRYVSEHSTPVPETARTVEISAIMPSPSAHAGRLSAMLMSGVMPHEPISAEVLSDTECTPDEQMISRCRNEMLLANGDTIVVRHPHDMSDVPCLAPGERVRLVPVT